MKIVINTCYGGFGLSEQALNMIKEVKRQGRLADSDPDLFKYDFKRNDPILISVVEELKEKANGNYASLKIVEIPDDVDWIIAEYDGQEHIAEKHRTWE